jgi:hypothetical protein
MLCNSADLSGQVFPTPVAKVWEENISREFEAQAKVSVTPSHRTHCRTS